MLIFQSIPSSNSQFLSLHFHINLNKNISCILVKHPQENKILLESHLEFLLNIQFSKRSVSIQDIVLSINLHVLLFLGVSDQSQVISIFVCENRYQQLKLSFFTIRYRKIPFELKSLIGLKMGHKSLYLLKIISRLSLF